MKKLLLVVLSVFIFSSLFVSCQKTEPVTEKTKESDTAIERPTNPEDDSLYGTYFRRNDDARPVSDTFTITLNSDGTYNYYETTISSHLGFGKYTVNGNIITITDDSIPTLNGSKTYTFKFEYRDGKLVFLASDSDNFMYVNLPDGAEFERTPQE